MNDPRLEVLKTALAARGWSWRDGKAIPYGVQLLVSDGSSEATLDFYPKRGRSVVGGAPSPLRTALSELAATAEAGSSVPPGRAPVPAQATVAELGMDESGKGDWFGPLVVAAVYVEPAAIPALRKAGVRDSKLLEPGELERVAAAITGLITPAAREVRALAPADYNARYRPLGNINLLLAELYAETAAALVARTGARAIVCDQFAQRTERLDSAFAKAGLPKPKQMHGAESASIAVAAASVLATACFQQELVRLGAVAGLKGPLPRGASAIGLLRRAAQVILAREGREGLARYAKLNFKPVQELLSEQPG